MEVCLNIIIIAIVFLMGFVIFAYLNFVIARLQKGEGLIVPHLPPHGRSRCCGRHLPVRELVIEIFGGIFAVVSVALYGISFQALLVFLVIGDLTVITFIDADTQEIPPALNYILLGLGVLSLWVMEGPSIAERLIGMVSISLPMLLLAILLNGFGGGDVKLMAAAGFLLGWKGNIAAFLIGIITGGMYCIFMLARRKKGRKDYFAFGPFLCIGIAVAFIRDCGAWMVQSYIDFIKGMMTFYASVDASSFFIFLS